MKISIKKMSALLTVVAVAIFTFALTSCSEDDEPIAEITYTYGFSEMSASHPDFLSEKNKIENTFKSALGITSKPFTKTGSVEECDNQVYDACKNAFDSLEGETWQGDYTFQVTNVETGEVVCTAIFSTYDENLTISTIGNKAMEEADTGDFYFRDGSFADKSTLLESWQKDACIGVVLKKGRDVSGNWADNGNYILKGSTTPMEVHGYVLALWDADGGSKCQWGSYKTEVGCDRDPLDGFNGYSSTQTILNFNKERGGNLEEAFPAVYHAAIFYEIVCPAPSKTSGWFLPSGGQCKYWLKNRNVLQRSVLNAGGEVWRDWYWSSSEGTLYPWRDAYYLNMRYLRMDSDDKYFGRAVRACLAF